MGILGDTARAERWLEEYLAAGLIVDADATSIFSCATDAVVHKNDLE